MARSPHPDAPRPRPSGRPPPPRPALVPWSRPPHPRQRRACARFRAERRGDAVHGPPRGVPGPARPGHRAGSPGGGESGRRPASGGVGGGLRLLRRPAATPGRPLRRPVVPRAARPRPRDRPRRLGAGTRPARPDRRRGARGAGSVPPSSGAGGVLPAPGSPAGPVAPRRPLRDRVDPDRHGQVRADGGSGGARRRVRDRVGVRCGPVHPRGCRRDRRAVRASPPRRARPAGAPHLGARAALRRRAAPHSRGRRGIDGALPP